jgi:hypothetical protein
MDKYREIKMGIKQRRKIGKAIISVEGGVMSIKLRKECM